MTTLLPRPFVFLRHGETMLNAQELICGRTDAPLTARGEAQARQAAPLLALGSWSLVVSSELQRARRTAELAVPGQTPLALAGLNERDWGMLEAVDLKQQIGYLETPPRGEAWAAFQQRVLDTLNAVLEQYEWPLVVAHSGVFRVIRQQLTGTPDGPRIGNAEPMLIQPSETGWTIEQLEENWIERRYGHR